MNGVSDGLMAGCHVIGSIPALGVAICLGFAGYAASVIPVNFTGITNSECTVGSDYFLIDTESVPQNISVGECLKDYDHLALAQLRERCLRLEAKDEEICAGI